jgi:hypothetical protein
MQQLEKFSVALCYKTYGSYIKQQIFDRIHGVTNCFEQSLTVESNIWGRTNRVGYEAVSVAN